MSSKNQKLKRRLMHIITLCIYAILACSFSYVITTGNSYIITEVTEANQSVPYTEDYDETNNDAVTSEKTSRGNIITVSLNGSYTTVFTRGETVQEIINLLGIDINSGVVLNYTPGARSYDGMVVEISTPSEPVLNTISETDTSPDVPYVENEVDLPTRSELKEILEQKKADESVPLNEQANETNNSGAWMQYSETASYSENSSEDGGGYITTSVGDTLYYTQKLYCSATAYTTENYDNKITATGTVARVGAIAVDPTVIPYGSRMYVVSEYGNWIYGYATAEDCGGGIKGNKVDLFFDTYDECIEFGVRDAIVYILP